MKSTIPIATFSPSCADSAHVGGSIAARRARVDTVTRAPTAAREQRTLGEVEQSVTRSERMRRLAVIVCAAVSAVGLGPSVTVRADAPTAQVDLEADPLSERGLDTLGDVAARAERERALRGPAPPDLPVREGEALTAPAGVREIEHTLDVTLDDGLATATETLRFQSTARTPAEVRYRLAVPRGAWLAGLEVCRADGCRTAEVRGDEGGAAYDDAVRARPAEGSGALRPVGHAARVTDARGEAIVVRAAPVATGAELTVRVRWIAPAAMHGGVVRLVLPPRGQDPRASAARVSVRAPRMLGATVDGLSTDEAPVTVEAWFPAELAATVASGSAMTASAWRARCGAELCARVRVAAGPRAGTPVELILLIDASPSTLGPARGRIEPAIAALLGAAPPGSRVRAVAFGSRAEPVLGESIEVSQAPLVPLAQASQTELGSATRLETAWQLIEPWLAADHGALAPLLVLVGDGGLSDGAETDAALAAIVASRAAFTVVDVGERAPVARLVSAAQRSGGIVVHAPPNDPEAAKLEERLSEIFAPVVAREFVVRAGHAIYRLPALRAGEERTWTATYASGGVHARAGLLSLAAHTPSEPLATALSLGLRENELRSLAAVALPPRARGEREAARACAPYGPPSHPSGVSTDDSPVALAEPRTCRAPSAATAAAREPGELPTTLASNPLDGHGVPAETLLAMLRTRVVPAARACFRADRAGRADYSVRASIAFELADRELLSTSITGELAPALRSCLYAALERLEVPRFEGTVVVRYPVYTEAAPPPPTIELTSRTTRDLDDTIGAGVRVEDVRELRRQTP
jgi:hypothetical protein